MVSFKKRTGVNIGRVVAKITITLLSLWVGGVVMTAMGEVMLHTASPFYRGLSLIGWTVGDFPLWNSTHYALQCGNTSVGNALATPPGATTCITDTTGAGILAVVGIIGLASIVLEFVEFKM